MWKGQSQAAQSSDRWEGWVEQREAEEDQSVREILKPKREPVKVFEAREWCVVWKDFWRWWVLNQLEHANMTLIMEP